MTYAIYEGNMERLEKKMTRIKNKCQKYGCDFRFEEVGEEYRELEDNNGNKYTARFVLIDAEGIAEINGWKFIASVEHTKNGNIINKACEIEVPSRYYTSKPVCEHCKQDRIRKDTYIVMNEDTGEFKQVGKSCLCDFTHGMSAEAVAKYTAAFDELIQGEAPYEGSHMERYIKTNDFLYYAAETVRHFGYVKSNPYSNERSTRERAEDYYLIDHGYHFMPVTQQKLQNEMCSVGFDIDSKETRELVTNAITWLEQQDESNNYIHNLKVACSLEYQTFKNLGIIASLFPTYDRDLIHQEKLRKEAEKAKQSEYVGEIGKRIEINVDSMKCVTTWETQWGLTAIFKITDENGNVFTWKTSTYVPDNVKSIKGTVKAHNEYRGCKQTELTRCKVFEK